MRRKKIHLGGLLALSLCFFLLPCGSLAGDKDISLQLWGQISPFIHGEAGKGLGAPDYKDAFSTGIGGVMCTEGTLLTRLNNFYFLALQRIPFLCLSKGLGEGSKAF